MQQVSIVDLISPSLVEGINYTRPVSRQFDLGMMDFVDDSSIVSVEKIKRIPLRIHWKCKGKENTKRISLSPLTVPSLSSKSNPADSEDDVFQFKAPSTQASPKGTEADYAEVS